MLTRSGCTSAWALPILDRRAGIWDSGNDTGHYSYGKYYTIMILNIHASPSASRCFFISARVSASLPSNSSISLWTAEMSISASSSKVST